jgi:thioredoxin-like negative regulator of GroEL
MTTAAEYNPAQTLNRAAAAVQAGRLVEAEQLCQEIIATNPDSFDALYLLALIQSRLRKLDAAAGQLRPNSPQRFAAPTQRRCNICKSA